MADLETLLLELRWVLASRQAILNSGAKEPVPSESKGLQKKAFVERVNRKLKMRFWIIFVSFEFIRAFLEIL